MGCRQLRLPPGFSGRESHRRRCTAAPPQSEVVAQINQQFGMADKAEQEAGASIASAAGSSAVITAAAGQHRNSARPQTR